MFCNNTDSEDGFGMFSTAGADAYFGVLYFSILTSGSIAPGKNQPTVDFLMSKVFFNSYNIRDGDGFHTLNRL